MFEVLGRAGCFVAIIILGYVLRKKEFFKEGDFHVLSKIVLKITLPAAIVSSFAGKEINPSMLFISLIGLGGGVIYMLLAYVLNWRGGKKQQSFAILNTAGYNIGNFTMPFVQSFLGSTGVIVTSLFDVGNAFSCLGGAFSVASAVKGQSSGLTVKLLFKSLTKSLAFDCYIIMLVLSLAHIQLPNVVFSFTEIIGNANAFTAMLMIGVGFKLSGSRDQLGMIVRILTVRYGVAIVLALGCYFLLPVPLEIRQPLVILLFSPIASAAPAFTAELGEDVGLASAVNSISIICSIVCIVVLLSVML